jgi:hypothetical protein
LNHSSGHVVAHNRISRTADGVSHPHRNCDIFGNDIFDVSDDGLEPDYGYANNRMWGNRITNCKNHGLSFQPMYCGPWYFIRNQVLGGRAVFKFRVQDRFLFVNNTFVAWGAMDGRMHHLLTALSRNNLFITVNGKDPVWAARPGRDPKYYIADNFRPTWMTDVDYDGFDWGDAPIGFKWNGALYNDVAAFAKAAGIEQHGRRVRKEEIFASFDVPAQPGWVRPQIWTLKPGGNAIDAGALLPNICENFNGAAPDLGAHESGQPQHRYGPRQP